MLKIIGLIGGMSWESTATYYRIINETIKKELGGLHSAKLLLYSLDFAEIEAYQSSQDWDKSADIVTSAAIRLEQAGADFIVICTNTMHKVADKIQEELGIPIIHIAEATAVELKKQCIEKVALMGTKYTMKQDFYKERIKQAGINMLIPDDQDIELINRIIYDELCLGIIKDESKREYQRIINKLAARGAQ